MTNESVDPWSGGKAFNENSRDYGGCWNRGYGRSAGETRSATIRKKEPIKQPLNRLGGGVVRFVWTQMHFANRDRKIPALIVLQAKQPPRINT